MASPSQPPPVAFRLKRPYDDEDQFIEGDGHGIFKSGMVLIGAGPRPEGLIVRFEIALRDGIALFRGEGKVAGHRMSADGGKPAGLEIKFTRLDARGKLVVDRALRARAAQLTSGAPPAIPDLTPAPDATRMDAPVVSIPPPATSSGPFDVPADAPSTGPVHDPPELPPDVDEDAVTRSLPVVAEVSPSIAPISVAPPADDEADAREVSPDATQIAPPAFVETRPYQFPIKTDGARDGILGRLRQRASGTISLPDQDRAALLSKLRGRVA